MKKFYTILMAVAALATSCIDPGDFGIKPEESKIKYTQEQMISAPETFTVEAAEQTIDLGAVKKESIQLLKITAPAGAFYNQTLSLLVKDENIEGASAQVVEMSADGFVSKADLQALVLTYYGREGVERTFEATVSGDIDMGEISTFVKSNTVEVKIIPEVVKYWGLVGDFNSWGGTPDINLDELSSGVWVSSPVELEGQIKLRFGAEWAVNMGLDKSKEPLADGVYAVIQDGDNLIVEKGTYIVTYIPNANIMSVIPVAETWGIIGAYEGFNWDRDLPLMLNADGVYVSPVFGCSNSEIKVRYACDWAENRGGAFAAFDTPFEAVPGGDNIAVASGFHYVTYNPAEETLTVNDTWGVIGMVNGTSWNADVAMYPTPEGLFVSDTFEAQGEFKIRYAGDWAVNRGGNCPGVGEEFAVVDGGDNISVPAGNYYIVYNPQTETLKVVAAN